MNKTRLKSIGAIVAGFVTVVVLSIGTDAVLQGLGVFPPQDQPASYTAGMLAGALLYRSLYTVAGGYVTAWIAPTPQMRHVMILGAIGIVAGTVGVVVSWNFSPEHWYPIALVITAFPCTWFGGRLKTKRVEQSTV